MAAAYTDWSEFPGALAQLSINLVTIVAAGIATLALERRARHIARRRDQFHQRLERRRRRRRRRHARA